MRKLIVFGVTVFLTSTLLAKQADYYGAGVFGGNGSRGFDKSDPNYEVYDTRGATYKIGIAQGGSQNAEASATVLDTKTALNNHVVFLGIDFDYIATPYSRQSHFLTPFISLGLGSYYFSGDTDNNNSTYDESEGIAFNAKVGLYIKISPHIEIETHMHGKSFLWNGSENDTGGDARRKADSMTNFYLGINWHL